ncbi:hypothetical protein JXO52_11850 [bacterium]|nr:hypothetical protein [bacterium]
MKKIMITLVLLAMAFTALNVFSAGPDVWGCRGGCEGMPVTTFCSCTDKSGTPAGSCVSKCDDEIFGDNGNCAWSCEIYSHTGEWLFTDSGNRECNGVVCSCSKQNLSD